MHRFVALLSPHPLRPLSSPRNWLSCDSSRNLKAAGRIHSGPGDVTRSLYAPPPPSHLAPLQRSANGKGNQSGGRTRLCLRPPCFPKTNFPPPESRHRGRFNCISPSCVVTQVNSFSLARVAAKRMCGLMGGDTAQKLEIFVVLSSLRVFPGPQVPSHPIRSCPTAPN